MNYEQVIEEISSYSKFGIKLGLERMKILLSMVGNPQERMNFIHVAGTNGKGSTCTMLSSILSCAGYRTGLYTSPSVIDFRDRIKINNEMITKEYVIKLYSEIKGHIKKLNKDRDEFNPTVFEIMTIMALMYFKYCDCDIVILETGLGGRLDATNVIENPLVVILTSISMDHADRLGHTLQEITKEKCGIIKDKIPVVTSENQVSDVMEIIKKSCKGKNANLIISESSEFKNLEIDVRHGMTFLYKNHKISTPLLGRHQIENISNVMSCINVIKKRFPVTFQDVKKGLLNTIMFSRMQVLQENPLVMIDGAHNIGGIIALKKFISEVFINKKVIGVVGMFRDKEVEKSLSEILPQLYMVITIQLHNNRATKLEDLTKIALKYNQNIVPKKSIKEALEFVNVKMKFLNKDEYVIIIFGSLSILKGVLLKTDI